MKDISFNYFNVMCIFRLGYNAIHHIIYLMIFHNNKKKIKDILFNYFNIIYTAQ